jgi:hypothetical protein
MATVCDNRCDVDENKDGVDVGVNFFKPLPINQWVLGCGGSNARVYPSTEVVVVARNTQPWWTMTSKKSRIRT